MSILFVIQILGAIRNVEEGRVSATSMLMTGLVCPIRAVVCQVFHLRLSDVSHDIQCVAICLCPVPENEVKIIVYIIVITRLY